MGKSKGLKILLNIVPRSKMRYDDTGDWFRRKDGTVVICSAKLDNPDYEFLTLLHELVEWYLCEKRGISQKVVDKFDMKGCPVHGGEIHDDPGVCHYAPYHREHMTALRMEKLLAEELGVSWQKYCKEEE